MTELVKLQRDELNSKIQGMETEELFVELEDTIQFDIAKLSNSEWLKADTKVYFAIINELKNRI